MTCSKDLTLGEFAAKLASSDPAPGGGGAAALVGALSAALCSMVANLTAGSAKYAGVRPEMEQTAAKMGEIIAEYIALIDRDAECFEPLAAAYRIPKDAPGRAETMEAALNEACTAPLSMLEAAPAVLDAAEFLAENGTRLAQSDVAAAASACRCALETAVLNIYANTKLMKDRAAAEEMDKKAGKLVAEGVARCEVLYRKVVGELRVK